MSTWNWSKGIENITDRFSLTSIYRSDILRVIRTQKGVLRPCSSNDPLPFSSCWRSAAWTVSAQEFRATLTGHVADPSGNRVPNAKVTAKNLATNEEQSQNTNELGDYTMPLLPPGNYSVRVEAKGFRAAVRDLVELHTGDKLAVNFALELGQVQDTVTVTGDAPLLETATASRGGVIENMRVTELPLNGRNPFALTNLSTGVIFAGNPQFTRPFDNGDNVNFSINGGLRQTNAWLLDGVPDDSITDTDAQRTRGNQNIAYIPTVDATQEFKIVTNFYDAQYGRTGGGVINVATKSGTNDFHGTGVRVPAPLPVRRQHHPEQRQQPPALWRRPDHAGESRRPQARSVRDAADRPGVDSQALQRPRQDVLLLRFRELHREHAFAAV